MTFMHFGKFSCFYLANGATINNYNNAAEIIIVTNNKKQLDNMTILCT